MATLVEWFVKLLAKLVLKQYWNTDDMSHGQGKPQNGQGKVREFFEGSWLDTLAVLLNIDWKNSGVIPGNPSNALYSLGKSFATYS